MQQLSGFEPGTLLAERYRVVRLLGVGAMGMVFEVRDTQLNDAALALKLLHAHLVITERSLERFKRETLIARRLFSPSLVRFFEFGTTVTGQYFITMELVEGVCLATLLEEGPINEEESLRIVRQIAQGLCVAHAEGIIHRDVKPQNILITPDGVAKLTDFGTARISVESNETLTRTGESIGTPFYMAPEQFRGEAADERTDVYALGLTLFELLTGEKPFQAETYLQLALQHLNQEVPSIRDRNPELPDSLQKIIKRATEKEPKDRFQTVDEFLEAIKSLARRQGEDSLLAQETYNKALQTDARTRRQRQKKLLRRRLGQATLLVLALLFVIPRVSQSAMMRLNVYPLQLEQAGFTRWARALQLYLYFPAGFWKHDTFKGMSLANISSRARYAQIARFRAGIGINDQNSEQLSALMYSCILNQERFVYELLRHETLEIDAADFKGQTALMHCSSSIAVAATIESILERDADILARDIEGNTALHFASRRFNHEVVATLLETAPQLARIKNSRGDTASHVMLYQALDLNARFSGAEISESQYRKQLERFSKTQAELFSSQYQHELSNENGLTPTELMERVAAQSLRQ